MDVFDLMAKLTLDSSQYDSGLTGAENKASSFGSKIGKGLAVGGAAMAAVGTAAVAAGTAVVKATGEVAAYGDNIDKMSQKMGISAEAYQEWDAVMQHSGTSMETMKASMKTLANAVEKGNEAFERIGLTQEQLASMSQEQIFEATIAGLQNVEDTTERTYLAGQLLGRGATELGALLNTSAEETQAMRDRVRELGGVMSEEAVKAAAKYQDTLQDLQTGFEGLKRNLLSEFLPGITTVMEGLTALSTGDYDLGVEKIAEGIDDFIQKTEEKFPKFLEIGFRIVMNISKSITQNLPKLIEMAVTVINTIINAISSNLGEFLPIVVTAIGSVASTILQNLPLILTSVLELISLLANYILTDGLPMIIQMLPDLIVGIVDFILSASTMITDAVVQILYAIIELIPMIVTTLAGALPQIISGVIMALMKNAPTLSQAILKLTIASLLILPAVIAQILAHIPEIFKAIGEGFKEQWPAMKENGKKALMEAVAGMDSDPVMSAVTNAIAKFIANAITKLKEAVQKFKDAGKAIMDGLIGGIQGKISEITNVISGVASTVSSAFKKVLGIASPSKLFESYGNFIDIGLAQGIDKGIGTVDNAMDSLYDSVTTLPKVSKNVDLGLYGDSESGYNGIVESFISALQQIGPLAIVQVEGNRDQIVDITVQANREYQRMTGNGLYA